jgi:hypothetical protein
MRLSAAGRPWRERAAALFRQQGNVPRAVGPDSPNLTPEEQDALVGEFARRYPHILEIATAATQGDLSGVGQGCDEQFEFEFALDLLLDGFDRLHRQDWRSSRGSGTHVGAQDSGQAPRARSVAVRTGDSDRT